MKERITFGQAMGLCLLLLFLIGFAALGTPATRSAGTSTLGPGERVPHPPHLQEILLPKLERELSHNH